MSDTSRVNLSYLIETTWGQIPAVALNDLRYTSDSLKQATNTTRSQEIRSDRQIPDIIRTRIEAQGGFDLEMSFAVFDDLIAGAMMADWSTTVSVSGVDISAASADNSYNSTTTDFTTENISAGQWILVAGFVNSANNGYALVSSVAANKLIVTALTLTDEAAGPSVTMKGSMIRNGTTKKSFTLEKEFKDITEFVSYSGMRVSTFGVNVSPENIVTGSFAFLGKSAVPAAATVGTGENVAAPANDVMNAIDNVTGIREGAAATSEDVTEISLELNNNLRGRPAVGVLGNTEIGIGTIGITGSFNVYFASRTLHEKYTNFTVSDLSFRMVDTAGNAYVVTLPSIKFTDSDVLAGGQDQDVLVNMSFEARRDSASDAMIQIDRFPI